MRQVQHSAERTTDIRKMLPPTKLQMKKKKKKTMTDDSTAHECDVFFFFSRSNWHENLLTSRSQRKQITKRFPVVLNKEFGIESELAKIAVVGRSAELV